MDATIIIVGVIALGLGLGIMFMVNKLSHQKRLTELEFKGKQIKEKAKKEANEIKYRARKDARKEAEEEKEEIEEVTKQRKKELKELEKTFAKKEEERRDAAVGADKKPVDNEGETRRRAEPSGTPRITGPAVRRLRAQVHSGPVRRKE